MGNVTSGENNEDLVDILKILGYIKTKRVERIFRAVDRGDYVLPSHRSEAYKDLSWKMGNIHLSAPCIYTKVMEGLSLEPGLSFLNIGSGTGYLSTMAGLILSRNGTNHGIELNNDCMEYAYEKLEEFKQKSLALDEFDFCEPVFIQGNCLKLECTRKYDRVYCGAACPESHEAFIKQFVKIGGILVMPYKDHLLRIERVDTDSWKHRVMLPVLFAPLIMPTSNCIYNNSGDDHDNTTDKVNDCPNSSLLLPFSEPLSLQELCRCEIRCQLRKNIWAEHPELEVNYPITGLNRSGPNAYHPITAQTTLPRYVMPLYDESSDNSPYITLNDDYDDDDDEDEDDDNVDNNDDEDNLDNNNDDDDDDNNNDNDVNNKDRSLKIRHRRNRKTRLFFCLEPSRLENEPNEEEDEDEGNNNDDNDDNDDDDEIEQVTSFRVLKNVSPKKSILNIFNFDKSTINNDDNNKTKDQKLSENAFQPSTSQYLSQGCSNNDNNQENSNDILFTSAKGSLDSLLCYSNSQINSDSQANEETMDVDKEQQDSTDENFQVADGTKSSILNPSSTSTNNIRNGITTADNNEANSNTSGYQEILDASNGIDNNGDDSMECLNLMKSRHQQKNNKWGISDHLNSAENHPSLSKRSKVNDIENNDDNSRENRPHPRVCGYNVDIESLSSHMKTKISQLPLPVLLRLYINYNRSL
ncbi:GSCOCG00004161001-RA-CDS [Cotesia congregata]|uniref:Similar to Pcmtd1: Protein-L-isoaspartate O-methyltransferase domain-containing protein 1 (Mus musculus) n=1 Tax=Cotesia congregata TaxID=51543 RepID=A0A8J2MTV7_COTCN|nr:GSCOCG00004161001-RA-CDS [Cotesia congregata]CAG5109206.1 Similar to Pcmtd1: Protein-L-isoaspartate O-methyltransferase domain-containing protein 1 (Mus musculus) [Cotesia congregata]